MLLKLISQEAEGTRGQVVAATALSGLANAAILAIVQAATKNPTHPSLLLLFMFILACALYAVCFEYSVGTVSDIFEMALYKLRLRMADTIRHTELQGLEQIGTSEIYERLTQETMAISQATLPIAASLQALVMVLFTALYLLYLSPAAFLLAVVLFGAGTWLYYLRDLRVQEAMHEAASTQVAMFDRLTDFLHGFKELRLRAQRAEDLYQDYRQRAGSLRESTVRSNMHNHKNWIFSQLNLFVLLAVVVFVMPQFIAEHTRVLNQVTAALLFVFGSISGLLWTIPQYARADMAAARIIEVEQKLKHLAGQSKAASHDPWHGQFQELRVTDVQFHYPAVGRQDPFSIGPLTLSIRAGEILFIVGGNGSGKSTFVKVLTALYTPSVGTLQVNKVAVEPANVQAYREMIAAIFGDFHLFKKLYGLPDASAEKVQLLLEQMRIATTTSFSAGSLSTLDLSTGQRKRLAMVIALLEDRPIYVFDEWAADQDPEFRRYFYEDLLPDLKRRGKTVIAISHDDRYFHCADRVITMEYGQIRAAESPGAGI